MAGDISSMKVTLTVEVKTAGLSMWTALKLRVAGPELRAKIVDLVTATAETLRAQTNRSE